MLARPRSAERRRHSTLALLAAVMVFGLLWAMSGQATDATDLSEERGADQDSPVPMVGSTRERPHRSALAEPSSAGEARDVSTSLTNEAWTGKPEQVAIRFEDVHGEALEGLLYLHVRRDTRWRSEDSIRIANASSDRTTQVDLYPAELGGDLCGYCTGYVPRRIVLRDQPGYPKQLRLITFRFERGVQAKGRVLDEAGQAVHGATVMIRSFETIRSGVLVSMGPNSSRVSGGIWEDATTGQDGRFSFSGLSPSMRNFKLKVGEFRQLTPDPRTFFRVTSDPFELDLIVSRTR